MCPFPWPWTVIILLHLRAFQMSAMSQKLNDEERENKPQCRQGSTTPPLPLGLPLLKAQLTLFLGLKGEPQMQSKYPFMGVSHFTLRPETPHHFHSCWVQPPGPTITAFCPKQEILLGRQFHSHAPSLVFFGSVSPLQHPFTLLISLDCPHTCRQSGPQPPPPPPFLKSFPQLSLSRS